MDDRRAEDVALLLKHPSWVLLAEDLVEAERRFWDVVNNRIRRGELLDQRELDYMRGRFDGAALVIKQPGRAAAKLAAAETRKGSELVE